MTTHAETERSTRRHELPRSFTRHYIWCFRPLQCLCYQTTRWQWWNIKAGSELNIKIPFRLIIWVTAFKGFQDFRAHKWLICCRSDARRPHFAWEARVLKVIRSNCQMDRVLIAATDPHKEFVVSTFSCLLKKKQRGGHEVKFCKKCQWNQNMPPYIKHTVSTVCVCTWRITVFCILAKQWSMPSSSTLTSSAIKQSRHWLNSSPGRHVM